MKRTQKQTFVSQANKKRVIDHVLKEEAENSPKGLSYTQKADVATKFVKENGICEEVGKTTIFRWFKEKEKTFEQVRAENEKDEKRLGRMKQLRPQDLIDFERKLNEVLIEAFKSKNIIAGVFKAEAEKLKDTGKWEIPESIKFEKTYRQNFNKCYGWTWRKTMGSKKCVPVELLQRADKEFSLVLQGYEDCEIGNFDESGNLLNSCGTYSFMLKGDTTSRKLNHLNNKERVTMAKIILKNGDSECPLIIDKARPNDLMKNLSLIKKNAKKDEKSKVSEWAMYKMDDGTFFGITKKAFMNRALFYCYVDQYDKLISEKGERRLLIVDQLSSHFFDMDKYKTWKKEGKVIYVDDYTFKNVHIAYLVSQSTAVVQPSDMGLYGAIQKKYSSWFNKLDSKFSATRGTKITKVIFSLIFQI